MEEISSLLFVENIHLFLQPLWPRSLLYLYQYSVIRARSSTILHFFQFLHPALIVYFPYHLSYYPPFPFLIFLSCNNFQTGRQSSWDNKFKNFLQSLQIFLSYLRVPYSQRIANSWNNTSQFQYLPSRQEQTLDKADHTNSTDI